MVTVTLNQQFLHPKASGMRRGATRDDMHEYYLISRPARGEDEATIRDPGFWSEVAALFVGRPVVVDVYPAGAEYAPFRLIVEGAPAAIPGLSALTITDGEGIPDDLGPGLTMPLPGQT